MKTSNNWIQLRKPNLVWIRIWTLIIISRYRGGYEEITNNVTWLANICDGMNNNTLWGTSSCLERIVWKWNYCKELSEFVCVTVFTRLASNAGLSNAVTSIWWSSRESSLSDPDSHRFWNIFHSHTAVKNVTAFLSDYKQKCLNDWPLPENTNYIVHGRMWLCI